MYDFRLANECSYDRADAILLAADAAVLCQEPMFVVKDEGGFNYVSERSIRMFNLFHNIVVKVSPPPASLDDL